MDCPSGILCADRDVLCNVKVTTWVDGSRTILFADRAVWHREGYELRKEKYPDRPVIFPDADELMIDAERAGKALSDGKLPEREAANQARALRRAKASVRRYARENEFPYFVTLTFSPERVDRHDDAEVLKKVNNWLKNAVTRRGLAYVLVPERHKDGAIHFHGFFNAALPMVDSGTLKDPARKAPVKPRSTAQRERMLQDGAQVVYNIPAWTWGFSTAIPIWGDYHKACTYVTKYIGKGLEAGKPADKIGGRWYYSGGALKKPVETLYLEDFDRLAARYSGYRFTIEEAKTSYVVVELDRNGEEVNTNREKGD